MKTRICNFYLLKLLLYVNDLQFQLEGVTVKRAYQKYKIKAPLYDDCIKNCTIPFFVEQQKHYISNGHWK